MSKKGIKQSAEHKAKRVAAWHASSAPQICRDRLIQLNKSRIGQPLSEEHKKAIAGANKGKQFCLGHVPTEEHRRKLSEYWRNNREKHNHYVDGKGAERTNQRHIEMGQLEYRLWREQVHKRDNYKCVLCGKGGAIHADHIKPYAFYPELRYSVENGRTLCIPCHRKTPTYGSNARKYKEQEQSIEELKEN